MADRREESSSSSSCSNVDSNESEFESPSHSGSSETRTTEVDSEIEEESTVSRPSGSKRKKSQPVSSTAAARVTTNKKRTRKDTSLKNDDIEELTSWIFSAEYAAQVEAEIRQKVMESPRVKAFPERERFAKHVLSEAEKPHYQLLIAGFCRKFSTLVRECSMLPDKPNRKAAFSVAWMKMLNNFRPGRASQERSIVERFLVGQQFNCKVVHRVVSLIHEMVYTCVHAHVQRRKTNASTSDRIKSKLCPESEETLYRYCGAALHRMIKLRRETLQQKKGRGKVSHGKRGNMEPELDLLQDLTMKDKSSISVSLQNLDEGNLVFPRTELIPFLRNVDENVREFACDANLQKYPTKFIELCQSSVLNNEELETDFRLLVASLSPVEGASNSEVASGLFKALVSKLANTRINEFMNAKVERDLKKDGKVVDADEMLRPKVKSYTLSTRRK